MNEAERYLRENFRLTSYGARVYLSLLASPLNAKRVASAARIPMPRVYDTLRGLEEMGFVREEGGVYAGVAPSLALEGETGGDKA